MGIRIGIVGNPNTGKSFSRSFLKEGKKTFMVAPNQKLSYLVDENDAPLGRADIMYKKPDGKTAKYSKVVTETKALTAGQFLKFVLETEGLEVKVTGNIAVVESFKELSYWTSIVDRFMPEIHTLLMPDFTHYISAITGSVKFIEQKSGGQAFQRFWDLAGEALNAYFTNVDSLRYNLVVVTEFHAEFVEVEEEYRILVPSGKMLQEKFLPDSYYDILLYARVKSAEEEPDVTKRFVFVVNRHDKWPARSANLFLGKTEIPNNLQTVLEATRKAFGVTV
jgi:hypothetical protein